MGTNDKLNLIVSLSIPSILAQITSVLMFFIDASMVGHLGAEASAAIGLVESTTWLFGSLTSAASMGFSVQVAHFVGANDFQRARQVFRHGLVCTSVLSVFIVVVCLLIYRPLPFWLGGGADIAHDASLYFLIFVLSTPFFMFNNLSGAMLKCSGNMRIPSIISVTMCLLDVVFNYVFIFVLHLGVMGAAIGSALAIFVAACLEGYFAIVRSEMLSLFRENESFRWMPDYVKNALKIASPMALQSMLMSGAQIVSTMIVAPLGNFAIAANTFAITAESLCYMPGYGIGDAATTLVGTVMTAEEAATQANYGRLITLENVSISGSGQNKTLTDAEGHTLTIKARDYMGVLPGDYVWPEKASKITGIIIYYMTGWFLMPISADAIVAAGVQPTEVTFAFNESLHAVGTKLTDINGFIFNETFTIDNVSLQVTAGSAQSAIYADASRGTCLAMYPMYAMMGITAPEGYAVTKIEFTQAGAGDLNMTPMVGTVNDHTWTGNADMVYFTMPQKTGTAYLAMATITLAEKNAETATAQIDYTECANIAAFNALADGTPAKVMLTDAEVIGVSANGYGSAWIQDATGGCLTQYSTLVSAFGENQKINGYVYTIARKNSGNTQMKEAIHTTKSSLEKESINGFTVVEGTLAEVNVAANKNKVVKISGANLTMTSATAGTLTQGDATIDVSNGTDTANQQLHKIENWTKDTTLENITIVAILTGKSDTANQLLPISITESTSGISNINASTIKNVQIYNLQGVRMNSVQKGLNIVNGKKIVMK